MRRALLIAVLTSLALPAAALAGGWATTQLSSLPPAGLPAGTPWDLDIKVMQHGVTPLEGIEPAVLVQLPDGTEKRFDAKPTGRPGVYHARVVFPAQGRYEYTVDDGFGNALPHTFPAVTIGDPSTASAAAKAPAAPAPAQPAAVASDGGLPWLGLAIAAALILLAFYVRSRRLSPRAGSRTPRAASSNAGRR
jgi:hypothetical protein